MSMSNNGLSKLTEEVGELQQVIGKALAYGLDCKDHPDGGKPLTDRFIEESGDVIASIYFIVQKYNLNINAIDRRVSSKLAIFKKWDKED